jgi:hypothetical protein
VVFIGLTRWDPPRPTAPDPFRLLETQARLTRLSGELEKLDRTACVGGRGYAPAFHLRAAMLAYQRTLQDACWIADLPITVDSSAGRLLAEVSLREVGWTW